MNNEDLDHRMDISKSRSGMSRRGNAEDSYVDDDSNASSDFNSDSSSDDDVGTPLSKVSKRSSTNRKTRSRSSRRRSKRNSWSQSGITDDDIELEIYNDGGSDMAASPITAAARRLAQDNGDSLWTSRKARP